MQPHINPKSNADANTKSDANWDTELYREPDPEFKSDTDCFTNTESNIEFEYNSNCKCHSDR